MRSGGHWLDVLGLRSPSLDSALRASLRLSKVRARGATEFVAPVRRHEQTLSLFAPTPPHPGDFVASLNPTYQSKEVLIYRFFAAKTQRTRRKTHDKTQKNLCVLALSFLFC